MGRGVWTRWGRASWYFLLPGRDSVALVSVVTSAGTKSARTVAHRPLVGLEVQSR